MCRGSCRTSDCSDVAVSGFRVVKGLGLKRDQVALGVQGWCVSSVGIAKSGTEAGAALSEAEMKRRFESRIEYVLQ